MADWGIKISEEGYDVKTCTDQQLILTSKLNALKVKLVGTTTGNVAHGLAYVPIYFFMQQVSAAKAGIVGQNIANCTAHMDATNFVSGGSNVKYYIFYQPGAA